jgi:hypothetical protein
LVSAISEYTQFHQGLLPICCLKCSNSPYESDDGNKVEERKTTISDFTTIRSMWNSNTDASPTWNAVSFGGSAGANEIRWCASGAGAGGTGSASWPQYSRPASGTAAVAELWYFTADTTGTKVATYDGTNGKANVGCIDYDNVGTYAAAPTLSAWGDNTHTAPSAGTQPGGQSGSPIVNGHATDTSSTSYLKGDLYGDDQTGNPSAGSVGSTYTVTTGTAGSVSPGAAAWLATWQSLQGAIQYITHRRTPAATTAGKIFFTLILYTGINMSLGTLQPVVTFTYSYV